MASQFINVSKSSINIYNPDKNVTAYIKFEKTSNPSDVTIKLRPTSSYYLSAARLENYKKSITQFLANPTFYNTINRPTIKDYTNDANNIKVTLTDYSSYVLLPYSSTTFQISTDSGFNTIVVEELKNDAINPNIIEYNANGLTHNTRYFMRARYGGGGYYSDWSETLEFTVDKPTIDTPSITPITTNDISYKLTSPYSASITVNSSSVAGSVYHTSTTWTIYGEGDSGSIVPVWSKVKDTVNLTRIVINNLFPDTLKYGKKYWVTSKYYSNDKYSNESNPEEFTVDGLGTCPPEDLTIFPSHVNVSNPTLGMSSDIKISVNKNEVYANINDITNVYWTVYNDETNTLVSKANTSSFTCKLSTGALKENTRYRLEVFYIHNSLGASPTTVKIFTTSKFETIADNLPIPFKTYNKVAYYGEINETLLSSDKLKYMGEYIEGKLYNYGEEVKKGGKLYVCTSTTPIGYTFEKYFKEPGDVDTDEIYRSFLPTPKWLINKTGLYPKLSIQDGATSDSNLINSNSGWLKCQNERGQTIFISKLPIFRNASINDLIRCDLFHPRRKTVRVGNKLYYVRILVNNLLIGNDALPSTYINQNLYKDQSLHEVVEYNENTLLEYLMNGTLAEFNTVNLDIDDITAKELVYHTKGMYLYRADNNSARIRLIPGEIDNADLSNIALRLVLERIYDDEHPLMAMDKSIPGSIDISGYDPILDYCHLGFMSTDEFISSEYIDMKTGLLSNKDVPNRGWFKFYYRGLIYFLSYGSNLTGIRPRDLIEHEMVSPTPKFPTDTRVKTQYVGKVLYNNMFFNVACPSVLTYTPQHKTAMTDSGAVVDIFQNRNINLDINMCYEAFLSDTVYPLLKNKNPIKDKAGYKGGYKHLNIESTIDQVGSNTNDNSTFITSNFLKNGNIILNNQKDPYSMVEGLLEQTSDAVFILTIHPNYKNKNKW